MNTKKIANVLKRRSEELLAQPRKIVPFTGDVAADALLNDIEHYPHAFVIACLMDRQWQAEKCWSVPYCLYFRTFDIARKGLPSQR